MWIIITLFNLFVYLFNFCHFKDEFGNLSTKVRSLSIFPFNHAKHRLDFHFTWFGYAGGFWFRFLEFGMNPGPSQGNFPCGQFSPCPELSPSTIKVDLNMDS